MKLKVFKNIDLDRLTEKQKRELKTGDNYVQSHGMPKTRREFLASGLSAGLSYLMFPTIANVLSNSAVANAAECVTTKLPAAIIIDGAGGYAVSGNMVFGDQGHQLLPKYTQLGLGMPGGFNVLKPFGANGGWFADISQLLVGINTSATPETLANTACLGIACTSQDDSSNNALNPSGMLASVLKGEFLPVLGENKNQPAITPSPASLPVGGLNDIQNAVGVNGSIANMGDQGKSSLFSMISQLTGIQSRNVSDLSGGEALSQLSQSSTERNSSLIGGGGSEISINPLDDAGVTTLWGLTANNINQGIGGQASAVYNAIMGNATMAGIEINGCDYHNDGRAATDAKDMELGTAVGRSLETAKLLGKPVFVMLTTDGSVSSPDSVVTGTGFSNDSGGRSGIMCFFYDPNKRPDQTKPYLGHFTTDGQSAARDSLVGGSPDRAVAAAVANYLSFAGKPDLAETVTNRTFNSRELGEIISIFK